MKNWQKALRFALCLLPVGLVGGWFAMRMSLDSLDPAALETAVQQAGSLQTLQAVGLLQYALYALVFGFLGYLLSVRLGLMRPLALRHPPLLRVLLIAGLGGAVLSLDAWTFGRWIPALGASYAAAGSFDAGTWIASILYGGVIEEVMMRLFLMSGLALIGWKLFFRSAAQAPDQALIVANLLSSLAFAAGHLPTTAQTFGQLTPLLVIRCFLLNGAAGLLFGRFYRKYGIQYAMLAHILFHLVSRTIWLITIP